MAVRWITEADTIAPTDPDAALHVEAASWILYKLTAEKYSGIVERTEWYGLGNSECFTCLSDIEHRHVFYRTGEADRIRLRGTPVISITSVTQGGVALSPTDFRVLNSMYLAKAGGGCWDLNNGVEVVYNSGTRPPEAGRQAAIRLANEFILSATDAGACSLPDRVTAISRQGMDYTILDPQDFLDKGKTGIYEIDLFLRTANPVGAKKKPRVFIADAPNGTTRR